MITDVVICRGVWNVPFISSVILFTGKWLQGLDYLPSYHSAEIDADMAFSLWMRDNVNHLNFITEYFDADMAFSLWMRDNINHLKFFYY